MLVLRPYILSHKPIHALVRELDWQADAAAKIAGWCQWAGYGLLIGGAVAGIAWMAAACWTSGSSNRR